MLSQTMINKGWASRWISGRGHVDDDQ